jgi:predicted ferric reductase
MGRAREYGVLGGLVALNALMWGLSLALGPGGLPWRHVIAQFFSTTAVILMSTNAILATRPKVLDRFFGGLDKLYVTHRAIGVTVALAVSCHFLLMPETPGSPTKPLAFTNITLLLFSIALAIAPRSPWRKLLPLRYQHWKLEHKLMGIFLALAVLHSLSTHPIMLKLPIERTWVYSMATLGLLGYAYREVAERFVKERHRYTVAGSHQLAADVLEVTLAPEHSPIAFSAGQFAFVRFASGPSREQHPFTLSAAPSDDGSLRMSIKTSGDYTRALHGHLAARGAARIEGAYGGFDYRRGGARQLWLAGGIGITPFLAFLGDAGLDREVRLVWSMRAAVEAVYRDEIERAIAEHPSVHFELWETGAHGRLTIPQLALERPGELSAFVCGPIGMRDAFAEQLVAAGVPRREVYYEEFGLR